MKPLGNTDAPAPKGQPVQVTPEEYYGMGIKENINAVLEALEAENIHDIVELKNYIKNYKYMEERLNRSPQGDDIVDALQTVVDYKVLRIKTLEQENEKLKRDATYYNTSEINVEGAICNIINQKDAYIAKLESKINDLGGSL